MPPTLQQSLTSDMRLCLECLGWHDGSLDEADVEQLASQGFLVLSDVIPAHQLERMRRAYDTIARIDNRADDFLMDLLNKDAVFRAMLESPRVLHAVGSVLNWDFKLHSVHGRNPPVGSPTQALHYDWPVGIPHRALAAGEALICNSAWMLDDMDAQNGPTRLVPGSHLTGGTPGDEMDHLIASHPRQIQITATAGSVLIFNGSLWHGGMANLSGRTRRVVHTAFIRRELPQPEGEIQREIVRASTLAGLNRGHRYLMDA